MNALIMVTLCVSLLAATAPAAAAADEQGPQAPAAAPAQERDPICGMTVDQAKAKEAGRTSVYEGKTFYFCNDDCKKRFDADPAKYAAQASEKTASAGSCCCHRMGATGGRMHARPMR
jgi:YHS domain-containing protein